MAITMENVWWNPFINEFHGLIEKHHKTLGNFPLVGTMLEASSQIYGMKVDIVHSDVIRLSTGLHRQSILHNEPVGREIDRIQLSSSSTSRSVTRRARRAKITIANSALITAKLQTIDEPNIFFSKLNSSIGNAKAKDLFQRGLPTFQSELSLKLNCKVSNNQDAPVNELDGSDIFANSIVNLTIVNWFPSGKDVLRPKITGYLISNTLDEHVRETRIQRSLPSINETHFLFDIDEQPMEVSDVDFLDLDVASDLDNDDLSALGRCTGLMRTPIVIDDLRPVTNSPLEYSYRRFLQRNHFWAGPSYWKVRLAVNTNKRSRPATRKKMTPVKLVPDVPEEIDNLFISVDSSACKSIRNANIRKWNPQNLKLPHDYKLNSDRFSCQMQPVETDGDESFNEDLPAYVQDHLESIDVNMITDPVLPSIEEIADVNFENLIEPNTPDREPDVSPEIVMNLPKANAVVNVKQLEKSCLEIIRSFAEGTATFAGVFKEMEKLHKNVLTPSLLFQCILSLANQNNFSLVKCGENNFFIRKI